MNSETGASGHLVIGGGLAGSMAALRLAAAGGEVTLLEKECGAHHKVCGEFLSSEAVAYLRAAGVDPVELGAETIRVVRLSVKQTVVEAALPFTALSLSRFALDEALLACAQAGGCNVVRGVFVERLWKHRSQWHAQVRNGGAWRSPAVLLATGKHDIGGWERRGGVQGGLVGFKLHWRLAPAQTAALRNAMELFLFAGGYGGLSLIENNTANLCLVVRRERLRRLGGWPELLAFLREGNRHLDDRLQGAAPLWNRPLAVFPIPYGFLSSSADGLWRLGDQAAVIPSFTGDGMSIALHSAALASGMFLAGKSADEYHRTLHSQLSHGISLAALGSLALVTRASNSLALILLSLFPDAVRWMASSTRVPKHALLELAAPSSSPELSCR